MNGDLPAIAGSGSGIASAVEEALRLSPRSQLDNGEVISVTVQSGIESGPTVAAIPPDPAQELGIDTFGAISSLYCGTTMKKRAT